MKTTLYENRIIISIYIFCSLRPFPLSSQNKYSPTGPSFASEVVCFELTFLFAVVGGLEAIVCLLVTEDIGADRACVEAVPLLTVLAEV